MTVDTLALMPPVKMLGLCGALLYVLNYLMLTWRLWDSESWRYFLANLAAASLVLVSLTHEFNAASAVIQVFFISVSILGLVSRVRGPRPSMDASRLRPLH